MRIIGINGFKRSGKGTTAKILADIYAGTVQEAGFADNLKVLAALTLGYEGDRADLIAAMDVFKEDTKVELHEIGGAYIATVTGRQYLQNLGNEARGVFGDTFWIDAVLPDPSVNDDCEFDLESMYEGVDLLAITDLRYENEAERVKALGGVVWEVIRPGLSSDGHASEQPLRRSLVDYQIVNDGTVDDLYERVADAVSSTC